MYRSKKKSAPQKDSKKEELISSLSERLAGAGYKVRRESLKRGPGWKVVSGSCVARGERLIFVDRRMSQDEQVAFLRLKLRALGIVEQDGKDEQQQSHAA